jgi:chitinase
MGPAATRNVPDVDFREELQNLQERMRSVLIKLQEVHAKISATADTADRLFAEVRGSSPAR